MTTEMMRIYMPEDVYWKEPQDVRRLYGERTAIKGCRIYYVITADEQGPGTQSGLEFIGEVNGKRRSGRMDTQTLQFKYDKEVHHLILERPENPTLDDQKSVQYILYNQRTYSTLVESSYDPSDDDSELINLAKLVNSEQKRSSRCRELSVRMVDTTVDIITRILNYLSFVLLPLNWAFKSSAVAQHFREWKIIFNGGGKQNSMNKLLPIVIDVLIGLLIMWIISKKTNPGDYLMTVTHEIIVYLRKLLESLRGSPVGLKVNMQLNDFLLNCFIYHINLWKTFLNIVSPAINYLFAILSIFGMCGFSFQLAMLSDLLVLITIHAHCFYIYAAVLYRLEIVGLKALWRIVLGRRKNVLKNRMESYDYKHSQLFLATLFFSSLLFLLPTVFVYYIVFSTVRLGIYLVIFTLLVIRRKILQLPVYDAIQYLSGNHIDPANVVMEIVEGTPGTDDDKVTVVRIRPQKAALKWTKVPKGEFGNDYPSLGQFIGDLFKGEIKGFIRPRNDEDK